MRGRHLDDLDARALLTLKRNGFSDRRLATLLAATERAVRERRHALGVRPVYKRVDTCAAEFATNTAYMYSTYEEECEAAPSGRKKIMVLGGGPNRIGQGIEFDYCCVHAALALREDGFETIMVNCNPETVSTDYDTSDRLYFEPLTLEDVLEIVDKEKPYGVIVQYGGQTPLKLARDLEANGVPIIGTTPGHDRRGRRPRALPETVASARAEAAAQPHRAQRGRCAAARRGNRLSAGGAARAMCSAAARWRSCTSSAISSATCARRCKVSNDSPVLLDRFLNDAIEVDVDAICDGKRRADRRHHGAHRAGGRALGRFGLLAAAVLPVARRCRTSCARQTAQMALALNVVGLMNVQFAIQNGVVLRARSESARLAHRAFRVQGDRPAAGQDRRALHGGHDAWRRRG